MFSSKSHRDEGYHGQGIERPDGKAEEVNQTFYISWDDHENGDD